jgi:ribosomal-protein-alanine N-acetyltransferase
MASLPEPAPEPAPVIETPRLILTLYRDDTEDDAVRLFENAKDPAVIAQKGDVPFRTAAEMAAGLATLKLNPAQNNGYSQLLCYMVYLKSDPTRFIGNVAIIQRSRVPDFGYSFVPEFWGHGYATEAAKAFLDYLRKDMKLVEIIASTRPGNEASVKVLTKIGFVSGGVYAFERGDREIFVLPGMEKLDIDF